MPRDPILAGGGDEFERSPEDFTPKQERYGLFRAVVEDTNDPDYNCRVKVRIDGINSNEVGTITTESLVWAERLMYDGGGSNHGDHNVPYAYGDTVAVILVQGRAAPAPQVFILGAWSGMLEDKDDQGEKAEEHYGRGTAEEEGTGENKDLYRWPEVPREVWQYFDRNDDPKFNDGEPEVKPYEVYPRRRVIKSRHGHIIEISDEPSDYEIIIRTPIGQRIWLRESVRCATTERPVWVDGLDTGETKQIVTSKMFPKSMQLMDDAGNYIWMNTEDGLLDIYWNGDKRERINGNFEQEISGHFARKVGHYTQFEYGYNPSPNNAPLNPLDTPMDDGTNLWVKELYHSFRNVLIKAWCKLWVISDYFFATGANFFGKSASNWEATAGAVHSTVAGSTHTSYGGPIVDHNSGPQANPANVGTVMGESEAQEDMNWTEPTCEG